MKKICSMDCLHCEFADCINDEELSDSQSEALDSEIMRTRPGRKRNKKAEKARYEKNKDALREYGRRYYAAHREKLQAYFKNYYETHKEENQRKCREYNRERYKNDPEFREREKARARENYRRRKYAKNNQLETMDKR